MILVFDIGNTRIKCGLFNNDKLISSTSFTNIESISSFINETEFENVCISSVANKFTNQLTKLVKLKTKKDSFVITYNSKTNIVLDYETPQTLGVDRICSVEGSLFLKGGKNLSAKNEFIITMDLGTATTINVLQSPNIFLGGSISPGIKLMFDSLNTNTAQLPSLNVNSYDNVIGKSTASSIASGVVNSTTGLLDKLINDLKLNYKTDLIHFFITGGNAESILPFIKYEYVFEKGLVLYGAYCLFKLNAGE
jgi:type III pantothenate kinase